MGTIDFDADNNIISLFGTRSSYSIRLLEYGLPLHLHWGAKAQLFPKKSFFHSGDGAFQIQVEDREASFFIEKLQFEYGLAEHGDYRSPAFSNRDGRNFPIIGPFELKPRIYSGKKTIPGLPAARPGENQDLESVELQMQDQKSGLSITLSYTMFPEFDVITRHVSFYNAGEETIKIEKAASLSMDIFNWDYELLYLHGAWARERQLKRRVLQEGKTSFGSTRGISSHQFNPSFALVHPETNEFSGEAYGFSLIYSGNFLAEFELNHDNNLRVNLGIHPDTFEWQLQPQQQFHTPEALLVYSDEGLNGMSHNFHGFIRKHIFPPQFKQKERPILFNNWEATYFNFEEKRLIELGNIASDLGIELFVLDDGWFSDRNSDSSSLGDWYVNPSKLPNGLKGLAAEIKKSNLDLGVWIEPEMISLDSKLAKAHPDWYFCIPDRPVDEGRNQLVLDLSQTEVCEFLIRTINRILDSAPIRYVKWDMNRSLTNIASTKLSAHQQQELYHRYVLGLYRVMEEVTSKHPDVLFEGCSGGGGRFDLGILYYMPQYWTSDNTDAISRLKIQYGTSIFYPPIAMGAHVSAVPNHQVGRTTSLDIRGHTAMSGNFGFELDLSVLSDSEKDKIKKQISFYKKHRKLIQFGRFIRLKSPFESLDAAWMFISNENVTGQSSDYFLLFWFRIHTEANLPAPRLKLTCLKPENIYVEASSGDRYTGSELMKRGIILPQAEGDYFSQVLHFINDSNPVS